MSLALVLLSLLLAARAVRSSQVLPAPGQTVARQMPAARLLQRPRAQPRSLRTFAAARAVLAAALVSRAATAALIHSRETRQTRRVDLLLRRLVPWEAAVVPDSMEPTAATVLQ